MTPDLHNTRNHATGAALLWLAPAAIVAAATLALLPGPAPIPMPASDPQVAVPAATSMVEGATWQIDHTAVDWAALNAEPDPSPMSVAAYGD